jgi:hypothetical protein
VKTEQLLSGRREQNGKTVNEYQHASPIGDVTEEDYSMTKHDSRPSPGINKQQ